jgi:hypothetical protein
MCTPHMNSYLCVNWVLVNDVCVFCKVESTTLAAARARRARSLVVREGCVSAVFGTMIVFVGLMVGVFAGREVSLCLGYECVWLGLCANRLSKLK